MESNAETAVSSVVSLWRYPVKSMMGEELNATEVTERGLVGDRAYALIDMSTGKVASAKNPRKWGKLFDFRARFVELPSTARRVPPVLITLPNGTLVSSEQSNVDQVLSSAFGREIKLRAPAPVTPVWRSTGRIWTASPTVRPLLTSPCHQKRSLILPSFIC